MVSLSQVVSTHREVQVCQFLDTSRTSQPLLTGLPSLLRLAVPIRNSEIKVIVEKEVAVVVLPRMRRVGD